MNKKAVRLQHKVLKDQLSPEEMLLKAILKDHKKVWVPKRKTQDIYLLKTHGCILSKATKIVPYLLTQTLI